MYSLSILQIVFLSNYKHMVQQQALKAFNSLDCIQCNYFEQVARIEQAFQFFRLYSATSSGRCQRGCASDFQFFRLYSRPLENPGQRDSLQLQDFQFFRLYSIKIVGACNPPEWSKVVRLSILQIVFRRLYQRSRSLHIPCLSILQIVFTPGSIIKCVLPGLIVMGLSFNSLDCIR